MKQFPWMKKQSPQIKVLTQEENEVESLKKRVAHLEAQLVSGHSQIPELSGLNSSDDYRVRCTTLNQTEVYVPLKLIFALWQSELADAVNAKTRGSRKKAQPLKEQEV